MNGALGILIYYLVILWTFDLVGLSRCTAGNTTNGNITNGNTPTGNTTIGNTPTGNTMGGSVLKCIHCYDEIDMDMDARVPCYNAKPSPCKDPTATSCRANLGGNGDTFVKKECSSFAVQCKMPTCVCEGEGCNSWINWKETPTTTTTPAPTTNPSSGTGRMTLGHIYRSILVLPIILLSYSTYKRFPFPVRSYII